MSHQPPPSSLTPHPSPLPYHAAPSSTEPPTPPSPPPSLPLHTLTPPGRASGTRSGRTTTPSHARSHRSPLQNEPQLERQRSRARYHDLERPDRSTVIVHVPQLHDEPRLPRPSRSPPATATASQAETTTSPDLVILPSPDRRTGAEPYNTTVPNVQHRPVDGRLGRGGRGAHAAPRAFVHLTHNTYVAALGNHTPDDASVSDNVARAHLARRARWHRGRSGPLRRSARAGTAGCEPACGGSTTRRCAWSCRRCRASRSQRRRRSP